MASKATPALTAEIFSLEWTGLASSNVSAAAYSPDFERMYVRFHDGAVYAYLNVPESIFAGLISAASAGGYLHRHVKQAGFGYVKVR